MDNSQKNAIRRLERKFKNELKRGNIKIANKYVKLIKKLKKE